MGAIATTPERPKPAATVRPGGSVLRWLLGGYVLLLHIALVVLVLKTNFLTLAGKTLGVIPPEEWSPVMLARILEQAEADRAVAPGGVTLVGDSIVAQVDTRRIGPDVANFGIGGDTTHTLQARLAVLRSLEHSRAVVVGVGVNDLKYRQVEQIAQDYDAMLAHLPPALPIISLSLLPVDEAGPAARERGELRNAAIGALNAAIRRVCQSRRNCRFLDAAAAVAERDGYGADGWHLSAIGSRRLAEIIRAALPGAR